MLMTLSDMLSKEVEQEFANTRKILERVPADKFDWSPHQKSMSLKQLASHIAGLASFGGLMLTTDELDFAQAKRPEINTVEDLLKLHDEGTKKTTAALKAAKDSDYEKEWVMRHGEHLIMKMPVKDFIRKMGMNHIYHHRAQLGVYLRLLDVPIPGMYGPSADDK